MRDEINKPNPKHYKLELRNIPVIIDGEEKIVDSLQLETRYILKDIVNDAKYIVEIHKAVQEITRSLKVEESGYRVVTNISKDAGQEVRHIHYHILAGEKLRKYEIIKFANKKGINMDDLFGTDSLSKKKKKIIDKEKEEKKRTIIVFVCLIIIASIVSYVYILFNSSSKIDNAKGILRRGFV